MPKINELPSASSVGAADLFAIENAAGTNTRSATGQQIKDFATADVNAEVTDLNSALMNYNCFDELSLLNYESRTHNGITFAWNENNTVCTVSGTASAQATSRFFTSTSSIPSNFVPGKKYRIHYSASANNVYFDIFAYTGSSTTQYESLEINSSGVYDYQLPSNTTGLVIRLRVRTNADLTTPTTVSVDMCDALSNEELSEIVRGKNLINVLNTKSIRTNDDLNNYLENEVYVVSSPNSISNLPATSVGGILQIFKVPNFVFQIFTYNVTTTPVIAVRRYGISAQTWTDWKSISGGDSYTYNTTQEYNQYTSTNTYNVTPTITTDSNNYLAPTGDNTDVSGSIQTMLENTGICRLGPGEYWVSGVDMPEGSAIIGSGAETKIYLLGNDNTEGYAIKMNSRCTVRDMSILGNTENYTSNASTYPSESTIVQRHGILWQGDYSTTQQRIPRRGLISGCYIANFTGGGITMYDTGPNVISGINVSDCIIWHCYAGINISYRSEYNRFTNIAVSNCHYGAVNNGGNNVFSNCGFSKNIVGFIIDNSTGTMTNNSHGSVVNCTFNHTDGNTGTGILLNGVSYGEIFTGCQLFYGKIELTNCNGIVFSGLNAGAAETININGGTKIVFIGSMFRTPPTINVNNNNLVTFNNCYCYDGTEVNP